jgi:transcription initiation factor TFIID subunit 1
MLMIKGVGDPSNGHGGYSFLKMPLKISNDSNLDCMKIRVDLNPAIQNPKFVTGTDADLRKLKKEEAYALLVQEGFKAEDINKLTRWEMVGLLRQSSNSGNKDDANRRFARGIRYTSKKQKEEYQNRVDELFKVQMEYLTRERDLHNDSDYEDPAESLVKRSQFENDRKE